MPHGRIPGSQGCFPVALADCHLHFEGSLPPEILTSLAQPRRASLRRPGRLRGGAVAASSTRRDSSASTRRSAASSAVPEDYGEAARAIARALTDGGLAYAEIYVSPEIVARFGLDPQACLLGDRPRVPRSGGGGRDAVPDPVRRRSPVGSGVRRRVLDLHEKTRLAFGRRLRPRGGRELPAGRGLRRCLPARPRARAPARRCTRASGAGRVGRRGARRPAPRPHGPRHRRRADPRLLTRLAEEATVLWVAPTSNVATGAVGSLEEHPLAAAARCRRARRARRGRSPPFRDSTTRGRVPRGAGDGSGFGERTMRLLAENAWHGAFCARSRSGLVARVAPISGSPPASTGASPRQPSVVLVELSVPRHDPLGRELLVRAPAGFVREPRARGPGP